MVVHFACVQDCGETFGGYGCLNNSLQENKGDLLGWDGLRSTAQGALSDCKDLISRYAIVIHLSRSDFALNYVDLQAGSSFPALF